MDIRTLVAKQFGYGPHNNDKTRIIRSIEDSLIIHEGAHLLLNDNLEADTKPALSHPIMRQVYYKESEEFAILYQMAFGPIPAHTWATYITAGLNWQDYSLAVKDIKKNMIDLIYANKEKFPNIPIIADYRPNSALEEIKLFVAMEPEQIRGVSRHICERLYKPIIKIGRGWHNWAIDTINNKIAILDRYEQPITPIKVEFSKEEYVPDKEESL